MTRWRAFEQLFLARIREFYREPAVLLWVYAFPLLLAVGLGLAFSGGVPWVLGAEGGPAAVAIQRGADSTEAAALAKHLKAAGLSVTVGDEAECRGWLRRGQAALIVVPTATRYQYVYDPQQPDSRGARFEVDDSVQRWKAGPVAWSTEDSPVSEPGGRYIDFLMPGLMGLNLMSGGLWGVGYAVADLRARKLLKRLLAAPVWPGDFLLALIGSRMLLLVPEMLAFAAVGVYGFGMPLRGSVAAVTVVLVIGAATFAGLGLLLACRAERTETISGAINLVMLPMWMFAGTFFSPARFPGAFQPLIRALPLTQLNDALRAVILDGASLSEVGWRLAYLAIWAIVSFALALAWFRWV